MRRPLGRAPRRPPVCGSHLDRVFPPERRLLGRDDVVKRVILDAVSDALQPQGSLLQAGGGHLVRLVVALHHGTLGVGLAALHQRVRLGVQFKAERLAVDVVYQADLRGGESDKFRNSSICISH